MHFVPLSRYLAVVFALSYAIQGIFGLTGLLNVSSPWIYLAFGLLAAAALGAVWWTGKDPSAGALPAPKLAPIPWPSVAAITAAVIGVFLLSSALAVALRANTFDPAMARLISGLPHHTELNMTEPVSPLFLLVAGFLITIALGYSLYALPAFCLELGWRAVCLPSLIPLGPTRAYLLTGLLQALAWAPAALMLLDSAFPGESLFRWCLWWMAVAAFMGAIWRRTNHTGLLTMVAGTIGAQLTGMWDYLFPAPVTPWGGPFGYIAILCWTAAALTAVKWPARVTATPRHTSQRVKHSASA